MKKAKKHNIKNISFLALTFSALCLAGCNAIKSSNSNVVEEMPKSYIMQKQAVMPKKAYGDNLTLPGTYTYEDWARVCTQVWELDLDNLPNYQVVIAEDTNYQGTISTNAISYAKVVQEKNMGSQEYHVYLQFALPNDSGSPQYGVDINITAESVGVYMGHSFTATLTAYPENFYNALENIVPPPPGMGEQIVDGVESGLGMIGTLASEFLAGFGALFYVNNQLTPFAIFSLVFLGIAITFAIIKLCLNVVRSNTGA